MKQKLTTGYRCWQLLWSVLLVLAIWNLPEYARADASQQDINGIVRAREMALQAIDTRDFSKIEPYLHPTFTITTVDNRVFHKVQEFENYWNQQFSSSIANIKMTLQADTPRTFLSPEIAVSYGDAIAAFSFKDGNAANMAMRWTAVTQKFQGKWTIQSLHFSANLLNNPVLNGVQQGGIFMAAAAGAIGFLLGAVAMLLWHRRRQQLTETV